MDRKTLEQNYQKSFGASPAAELEQNYQRSGIDSLVQSVKKATQYNPSAPSTQPGQAAPAGASSRKQSAAMKQNVDTLKKQRDDALIKAGAYHRAGMKQEEAEQLGIASRIYADSVNAETKYKTQKNIEATEDYDPSKNKFKAGTATLASLQDFGQSFMQGAGVLSHYLGDGEAAYRQAATSAKNLMDKGVSPKEALEASGVVKKDAAPITDYKTVAELKREKDRASVGTLEGLGLDTTGALAGMAIPAAVTAITKSPAAGLLLMSVSSLGHKYADAYEKYGNGDLAFALGLGAGAATYTTEQIGGVFGRLGGTKLGQAATKKLMSEAPGIYALATSTGGELLRVPLEEGLEEGAEDVVNYAIEKALTGESDEMDNIWYDMLLGALAGGVMGSANAATRAVNYNRLGKTLKKSPAAVQQQIEEGLSKGEGTAPAIYAAEAQKKPTPQMLGRLFEANQTFDAESGLSKIQGDITQLSIRELKAMMNNANAIVQAAETLGVKPTPESVMTEVFSKQKEASIRTAQDGVGQAFAPTVDNPANAGEKAYNSALAGVAANQGVAARINNDPAARQAFSQLTGVQFSGNTAQDIAAIEVATQNLAKSGKQAISQAEYAQRVAAAGEQAAAQFDADMQAQAEQMQRESDERWLSVEQNTITDVDGKRRIKEITNTDVRGNTEIGYKKAEILGSKKKAVAEVNNAAKYLGKTIVWFEGAVQVNGQYRLTNGYRAPDGTIYVNINSRDPLMVTFGHEMFHDLVADSKYSGMIDTLVENPDYADMVKGMMNAKTELYERNGIELDPNAAAEEVAADISGDLLGSRDMLEYIGARNTEAATGIKGFLNRILKKLKGKPSAQEAYNRLSESQKALLDGMEGRTEVEEAGKISYSLMREAVEKNNRPFAEQFADYKAGKMKPTELFALGNTSQYLQAAGIGNEPIVMAQSVVAKAQRKAKVDTHGHNLSDNVLLKLPEMLDKPALLLKSDTVPNAAVIVTSTADSDGNPVVVALHLSRSEGFDIVTRVASLYGKENSRDFLAEQMLRGNLLGYSKKEANRLLHRDGLQLPRRNTAVDFDTISVAQDTDAVNNYSMQNSAEDALLDSSKVKIVGNGDVDIALPDGYEDIGIAVTGEGSAAPNRYSLMSFRESELGTDKVKYATRLAKATGVSVQLATDWINSVYSVAAIIGDDKVRLDYEANRNNTSLKPNSEYDFSLDFSTLCAKRLLFSGTMDAIQSALPNTPLTSEDFVHLREIMKDSGYEVACGICYVESTRREFSTISEGFVEQYRKAQAEGTNIKKVNASGQTKDLTTSKGIENSDPNRFVYPEKGFTPTLADLVTAEGIDRLQAEHPEVYKAFNAYMNARGQQKPKMIETRTDYRGEILNMTKGQVSRRNSHGGLRIQSFSDFEVPHLIDMMQAVYDMASMGLKGQAYTKVPSFARAMGRTGIKINLSLIAKGDGVDANGKLIFDDVEGMPAFEAFSIRNDPRFSENVGTILVGKNVKHIVTAMADPEIDFIIPFHKSSWSASLYKSLGLEGYEDFTDYQNEKKAGTKIENYDPAEYWDFSKTGDENAQIYLEKCRADGRTPKFAEVMYEGKSLTEYPGYWKLLIDYKMYNNDGVGAPQQAVKPVFDDAYNAKMLSEYKGGHGKLPVAHDIVDRFLKEKSEGNYSLMEDAQYMADIDRVVSEATEKANDELKAAQAEVKNIRQQLADYRQQATAEAKNTAAWKEGEAKLIADLSEAQSKEKKARVLSSYMDEYNALSERYRGEVRATDTEALTQYNEKLSNLRSGFRGEMEKLAIEQGAFKRGEKAARDIYVPTSVNGQKVTRGTRTILEASQTPESMLEEHAKEILAGARGYEVISDKKAQEYAERIIDKEGYDKADELFTNAVNGDQVLDKKTLVLGEYLYMEAAKAGDVKNAMRYAADVAAAATRAGQVVQAMRVLKKATPTGKLYYLNRMVDTMNKNMVDNGGDPIQIDEGLARKLLEAENIKDPKEQGKAVDETIDEIEQNIADQIPATAWDKWNAWRYLSMLGNIRTQVRNVVGNAAFMPLVATKNLLAAGMEKAFIRNGGRTKSAFFTKTNVGKRLMEFGKKDFDTVVDEIQGGGKYNQSSSIEEKRTIFKSKAIEGWRKLTNKAMDKGDEIFSKHHYARALAGYLYANHLDYDKITRNTPQAQEALNKARAYAILEAQKATFRDANQFASFINKTKRNLLKKAQTAETKGAKAGWYVGTALAEGVMPFTKTPIDIAVRGIEYSPIGLIKGIKEAVYDVKKGNKTAAEAIDTLSAGLTGTGIFALGYFLQSLGFLAGALGSDKDEKYKKDSGAQGFALHIGDKYYTIDWLAPFSLPLFTGAAVAETVENGDEVSFATLADALSTISEPMLEMSMLQGLNAALSSGKYGAEAAIASFVTTNGLSYLAQANPTILGQIARAVDDTSRNAYYYDPNYKGFVKQGKVFVDKQLAKVPFASKVLTSRIDLWGNKQENTGGSFFGRLAYNMLSPGYYSEESSDPVDVALTKLYEETEDTAVLPSKPKKFFKNNKTTYKMNAKQYEEFCIVEGQTAHKEIQTFINSAEYKKMSNEDRVGVLDRLYTYSAYKAQKNLLGDKYVTPPTYGPYVKAEAYAKGGNPVYKYFLKG